VKKLEADLVNLNSTPNEKKSNKKLIEEKDKLIEQAKKSPFPLMTPRQEIQLISLCQFDGMLK
jgi:hypothetical protein